MLGVEDDDNEPKHEFGSALNPSSVGIGSGGKEEIAKPHTKIDFKVNNRNPTGGSSTVPETAQVPQEKAKWNQERDIWNDEDVMMQSHEIKDDRKAPEFDVMYKQSLGTEDVYLGLSEKDPSSTSCEGITVKIKLPGCWMQDIQVDVKKQEVHIQSSRFVLHHILPYPVDSEKGKAKWDKEKETLILELITIKPSLFDAFMGPMRE
jgi:dynein assembly factor 6, axonemal